MTGQRGSSPVSPMNRTGQLFTQQQAQEQARKRAERAATIDIEDVKKAEFLRGWDAGYDAGVAAVIRQLEDQDDEPGDVEHQDVA